MAELKSGDAVVFRLATGWSAHFGEVIGWFPPPKGCVNVIWWEQEEDGVHRSRISPVNHSLCRRLDPEQCFVNAREASTP